MAEIFGIGLTHYPPLCGQDEWFGQVVSWALADPGIPDAQKDPANWPARKREEWADDKGEKAAARHRAAMVAGFEQLRQSLDDFAPYVVLIWGDDDSDSAPAEPKTKSKAKSRPKAKPVTVDLEIEDLPDDVRDGLVEAARKKMRKSRASYEKLEGSGLVDWTISVTANGGRK